MAAPTKYSEAELDLIGLMDRYVKRLRAEQCTRRLTLKEMDLLLEIVRTNADLRARHTAG